jgi:hypothetical protein
LNGAKPRELVDVSVLPPVGVTFIVQLAGESRACTSPGHVLHRAVRRIESSFAAAACSWRTVELARER